MSITPKIFVAFAGTAVIARGAPADVALRCKARLDQGEQERVAVFDDETGRPVDIDFTGDEAAVLAKLAAHPMVAPPPQDSAKRRGPGRPKLGVVSREVSLLPRHWRWLAAQGGGASPTLRKLVDAARKEGAPHEETRQAIDAAHRFMWDIAGDQPDFEEATRALFAQDFDTFAQLVSRWPSSIREQLERFTKRARHSDASGASVPPGEQTAPAPHAPNTSR